MKAAVETADLTKDFTVGFWRPRPFRALDRLTLDVPAGEVFGLLGPNGAGKTTTLTLLMQLVYPTSGSARLLGRPVGDVDARRRVGYLPENPYFYDYLTAEELLGYFARLFGHRGAACRKRVGDALDQVGIGGERRLQLRKFSKGMLQRVGLAQALLNDPELVVLDEPMSGLDPIGRHEVRALILKLRDEGRTVLFSSHILSDAETLCRRVAILAGGRLVAGGRLGDLTELRIRGWEVVVGDVDEAAVRRLETVATRIDAIADRRFTLELPLEHPPERVLGDLLALGGHLLSVQPLRETLEDYFVEHVRAATGSRFAGHDRSTPEADSGVSGRKVG